MPLIGGVFNPPPPSQHGRVADWFAQLNNKMGGDLKKIQNVGRYMVEIWKAVGMDMSRVEFLYASGARACAHVCVCGRVCAGADGHACRASACTRVGCPAVDQVDPPFPHRRRQRRSTSVPMSTGRW